MCFSWSAEEMRSAGVASFNQACMTPNMHVHVHCSAFSGWASNLIANLDPTTLLFEDDEDYDYPNRCACGHWKLSVQMCMFAFKD
jgi:hypothetical protein